MATVPAGNVTWRPALARGLPEAGKFANPLKNQSICVDSKLREDLLLTIYCHKGDTHHNGTNHVGG